MRATFWIALSVLLSTLSHSVFGQNWPQFRGPEENGVVAASVPAEWSLQKHVAWKVPLPGVGWSQPVVWSGKVFLTTAVSPEQKKPNPKDMSPGGSFGLSFLLGPSNRPPNRQYQWKVLCLDAPTGEILWEQTARQGRPNIPVHLNNTYATETPATDGERLIAYFGMNGVYCYDLAGKLLWSKELGSYPTQFDWGPASSPVMYGDAVYVQCDNEKSSFLVALDKRTGEEMWRAERDERTNWSSPYLWKNKQRTDSAPSLSPPVERKCGPTIGPAAKCYGKCRPAAAPRLRPSATTNFCTSIRTTGSPATAAIWSPFERVRQATSRPRPIIHRASRSPGP
jgi:outer membrane protein assembly factor BamB